jgi:hypothetical protein
MRAEHWTAYEIAQQMVGADGGLLQQGHSAEAEAVNLSPAVAGPGPV